MQREQQSKGSSQVSSPRIAEQLQITCNWVKVEDRILLSHKILCLKKISKGTTQNEVFWQARRCDSILRGGNDHGIFVLHNFKGKTRFCVGTYEKFADTYLSYPVDICHIYEVVRDRKPVRLYFSIDIPDCDGVAVNDSSLLDILIRYVNHCLHVD